MCARHTDYHIVQVDRCYIIIMNHCCLLFRLCVSLFYCFVRCSHRGSSGDPVSPAQRSLQDHSRAIPNKLTEEDDGYYETLTPGAPYLMILGSGRRQVRLDSNPAYHYRPSHATPHCEQERECPSPLYVDTTDITPNPCLGRAHQHLSTHTPPAKKVHPYVNASTVIFD